MPPSSQQALSRSAHHHAMAGAGPTTVSSPEASRSHKTKAAPMGDKVVVRRIPPSMSRDEFLSILGPVWQPGNGKVGWFTFEPGKISKDPSKPPKPARAYLQVLRKDDLYALSETIRTGVWEDAAASFNHPGYLGPPVAEFSMYKKIPNPGKRKTDVRQGTIDQDPEFMDFLEKLANPPTKGDENGGEKPDDPNPTVVEITTTPLIEAIREKKATKAREAANAKSAKQSQAAAAKEKKKSKEKEKEKDKKADKPKETVKILTKKAAQEAAAGAAKNAFSKLSAAQPTASGSQAPPESDGGASTSTQATQKSRRAGIAAAARILQRDLGISPGSAHRRARLDAQKAEAEAKTTATPTASTTTTTAAAKDNIPTPPKPEPASTKKQASRPATPTAPKAQQQASQQAGKRGKGKQQQAGGDAAKGKHPMATAVESAPAPPPPVPITILKKEKKTEIQNPPVQPAAAAVTAAVPAVPTAASVAPPSASAATSTAAAPPPSAPTGPKSGAKKGNQGKNPQKKAAAGPQVSAGATRAFVKHANPSQGVTEQLLKASLETFGTVVFVEIDRRKGFAYVDFADHEGLVKAMTASPIQVAQGTVQVLERRDKPNAQKAGGGGSQPAGGAAGEKGGKSSGKNNKDADSKAKTKENQPLDGGGASSAADKSMANAESGEKAEGAAAGGGGSGGKPKVRRGGRGRGARAKDGGGGGGNSQQGNQQQSASTAG